MLNSGLILFVASYFTTLGIELEKEDSKSEKAKILTISVVMLTSLVFLYISNREIRIWILSMFLIFFNVGRIINTKVKSRLQLYSSMILYMIALSILAYKEILYTDYVGLAGLVYTILFSIFQQRKLK